MEMCIGDEDLRHQKERMDKLSQIRLKIRASQYLENLRIEVLADNLYRTEKKTERQREEPMADLNVSRQTIIIAKIQAELLKRILPSYKSPVLAVQWMKIINENHQKMESVHKELSKRVKEREDCFRKLEKERMDRLSQIRLKLRASQYLENLRNEVLAVNLYRTEKKVERQREEPMADLNESRQTIIIAKIQAELLKKILPSYKSPVLAVKWMEIINENKQKMESVHKELLKEVKEREGNSIRDSFRKLENVNQSKWNDTLDAWSKEKRNQIVFSILVDQVRKIRTRKCPQMAGKNMKRLQDRHLVLIKLQEELMKIVKERASMRQTKKIVEEELLMEIKRKDKMKKRGKMLQIELMNHCERSDEEDTHFTPRKLFLNSVETFKIVPKLENESNVVIERKDGPSVSLTCEDQPQPLLKREKKPTLKSRIKKMFGFH